MTTKQHKNSIWETYSRKGEPGEHEREAVNVEKFPWQCIRTLEIVQVEGTL